MPPVCPARTSRSLARAPALPFAPSRLDLVRNADSQNPVATTTDESLPGVEAGRLATGLAAPATLGKMAPLKAEQGVYAVSAGLRARHALVVITVVALITGCSSSEPQAHVAPPVVPGIQLPVFEKSCAPQPGPPSVVPIRVVGRAAIVANVCIGGEGPFPFLVDTGDLQLSWIRALRRGFTSPSLTGLGLFRHSPASGRSPSQLFHDGR